LSDFLSIVPLILSMGQGQKVSVNMQDLDAPKITTLENGVQSEGKQITIGEGFSARSFTHTDFAGLMDPLIMVDHFVMTEPTFGTHPHAGLSAVTVMFEDSDGAFRNRDSLGNDIDLAPGDLYWFKAARGAVHNEQPHPGARAHALQVFVGLPSENRHDAPSAFHIRAEDIPFFSGDRSKARLVLGRSHGVSGAIAPDVSLTLLDINIQAGGRFVHQGESGQNAWILAIEGSPTVTWSEASTVLHSGNAVALESATDISILSEHGARAVLCQGQPLRGAFVQRGPFAMGSEAELDAVEADYRAGRLGAID